MVMLSLVPGIREFTLRESRERLLRRVLETPFSGAA
jgi:hypothetical protein